MGEFGAVSVVSGHIRGLTNTLPLHVEILYNEYNFAAAFAVASLLASWPWSPLRQIRPRVALCRRPRRGTARTDRRRPTRHRGRSTSAKDSARTRSLRGFASRSRAGELLALLGPSGSGKTTLLRIIAGLETPDSGRIVFGGADATRMPVQERRVGFVFQHYALFRHMTVFDNIAYGLTCAPRARRPARAEITQARRRLLDLIQLADFGDRYPAQLSGGQRQRVALARALAIEPRVLLLDEPFGALDAQVRKDLRRWLRDIHERTGQTTIFVTHDQDEAMELADRVAILNAGRIEQIGDADRGAEQTGVGRRP